jgi:hypothetical protein
VFAIRCWRQTRLFCYHSATTRLGVKKFCLFQLCIFVLNEYTSSSRALPWTSQVHQSSSYFHQAKLTHYRLANRRLYCMADSNMTCYHANNTCWDFVMFAPTLDFRYKHLSIRAWFW